MNAKIYCLLISFDLCNCTQLIYRPKLGWENFQHKKYQVPKPRIWIYIILKSLIYIALFKHGSAMLVRGEEVKRFSILVPDTAIYHTIHGIEPGLANCTVRILDGNSAKGAHVRSDLCNLICLNHSIGREKIEFLSPKRLFSFICAQHVLSYHLNGKSFLLTEILCILKIYENGSNPFIEKYKKYTYFTTKRQTHLYLILVFTKWMMRNTN